MPESTKERNDETKNHTGRPLPRAMNNMGAITEAATAFPGNTGQRPDSVAPLAEMLRLNGYSTAHFGKNHETAAWEMKPRAKLLDDKWELYDTRQDFSLVNDLAAVNPAKLKTLQHIFLKEAIKYRVLPIDDRSIERLNAAIAGRPDLMGDRTSLTLAAGMVGMSENVFINIKNRSHSITADVEVPEGGGNGVILAQGGRFGGWSLYLKDGKPAYCYNFLGLQEFKIPAPQALGPGKATVCMKLDYDGGGTGKGGTVTMLVNGEKVASGRVERTQPTPHHHRRNRRPACGEMRRLRQPDSCRDIRAQFKPGADHRCCRQQTGCIERRDRVCVDNRTSLARCR